MLYHKTYPHATSKDWVVFVHGAGGSSNIWFKQIKEFGQHFNVVLIDLRGHGKSRLDQLREGNPYTFELLSRDVLEVMDHLSIGSAHLVGISLGTIIIRTLSEMAPDRVQSMIMGGAIPRLNTFGKVLAWFGWTLKDVMPYMWLYSLFAFIIMPRKANREARLLFYREAKRLQQQEFLRWYRLVAEVNGLLRRFWKKEVKIPTLYLMGENDHMFLPQVKKLVRHQRNSLLRVVQGSGHVCNVERPEEFNACSINFIQEWSVARQAC